MRNTWGFPSSPWVYPRWWRRPPSAWTCWTRPGQEGFDPALFRQEGAEWFVTPRNVDSEVETLSRVLGLGISTALHVTFPWKMWKRWIS